MVSRKSVKKTARLEAIARRAFTVFSNASWSLDLAAGDEYSQQPAPASEQEQLRTAFYAAARLVTNTTARVNLRNVSARFLRARITLDQIPEICSHIRYEAGEQNSELT